MRIDCHFATVPRIAIVAVFLPLAAAAQSLLTVEGTTEKSWAPEDPDPQFELVVDFDKAKAAAVEVAAISLKLPSGRVASSAPCKVGKQLDAAFANRLLIAVAIPREVIVTSGDYVCTVRFDATSADGKSVVATVSKDLKLVRVEPGLTPKTLEEQAVRLVRLHPLAAAKLQRNILVAATELSGVSVKVSTGPVYEAGTRNHADGKITPSPATLALARNGSAPVSLAFADFESAGSFESELRFETPEFSTAKTAKLKIEVKDFWLNALVVILLGVIGGARINAYVKRTRPMLETRVDLLRLRERARLLQPSLELPADVAELHAIEMLLDDAESDLQTGDVQGAETSLTSARGKLSALETKVLTAVTTQQDRVQELVQVVSESRADPLFDSHDFAAAQANVELAQHALFRTRPGETAALVDAAAEDIAAVYRAAFRRHLANVPAEKEADVEAPAREAWSSLTSTPPNTLASFRAIRAKIAAIADLNPAGVFPMADAATRPTPRISLATAASDRRAGAPIRMLIDDPPPGPVAWTFGDGATGTGLDVEHVYMRRGSYRVVASLNDGTTAELDLNVMPSELVEMQAALIATMRRNDLIVTSIAVVLAVATGLLQLYIDKPFGTLSDYIVALIWGFGIERTTRGFAAIFTAMKA